jgi:hypothetical protein
MHMKKRRYEVVDWINVAQGRIQWRDFVDTVLEILGNFLT